MTLCLVFVCAALVSFQMIRVLKSILLHGCKVTFLDVALSFMSGICFFAIASIGKTHMPSWAWWALGALNLMFFGIPDLMRLIRIKIAQKN